MDKKKIYYSSRFWIWIYCIVFIFYMCLQYTLGLLVDSNLVLPENIAKFINAKTNLPLEIFSWGWTGIVCLYCGSDRFVDIKNTINMPSGQFSMGDLNKLRQIIMASLGLLLIATVFSFTSSKNFELEALALTFVFTVITYTSGNKLVKAFKYSSAKDENADGIPDSVEDEYNKWKRQQEKDGIDSKFITLEYFLDEHEELRKKLNKDEENNNKKKTQKKLVIRKLI